MIPILQVKKLRLNELLEVIELVNGGASSALIRGLNSYRFLWPSAFFPIQSPLGILLTAFVLRSLLYSDPLIAPHFLPSSHTSLYKK